MKSERGQKRVNPDDNDGDDRGWIEGMRKVPAKRRYVAEALNSRPASEAPLFRTPSLADERDRRVPPPEEIWGIDGIPKKRFVAYQCHIHNRGRPPIAESQGPTSFEQYEDKVAGLAYRQLEWKVEHDKHISSSEVGKMLGLDRNKTPERYWSECRKSACDASKGASWFSEYIMARGLRLENFVRRLYGDLMVRREPDFEILECPTKIHPVEKWLMATPDGIVVDRANRGVCRRLLEFKCPKKRKVFKWIPGEYMAQIQFAMHVLGIRECDFMQLCVDDDDPSSGEFVVHRVRYSEAYVGSAIPVVREFVRATLTDTAPPKRGRFCEPPVEQEQIFSAKNAVRAIAGGAEEVRRAILSAKQDAHERMSQMYPNKHRGSAIGGATGDMNF